MNESKNEICPAEYLLLMTIHTSEGTRLDFLIGSKARSHKYTLPHTVWWFEGEIPVSRDSYSDTVEVIFQKEMNL